MEFQRRSIVLHLFLSFLIHTQIEAARSLNQASLSAVDLKRHDLTVETVSFLADHFKRRQLAGGGGSSGGGGGGSRGGSSGGSSSGGGGSRGGGGGGGTSGGGGSSGGSGGNKGGKGGGGGGGGDRGSGNRRRNTNIGGQQVPGGRFPNDGGASLQYSLVLFIFTASLVIM